MHGETTRVSGKFEARNPKQAQMTKIQNKRSETVSIIRISDLFRISIFGFASQVSQTRLRIYNPRKNA